MMTRFPKLAASERDRLDQTRNEFVKKLVAAERAKVDEKTAKLKALRMAKEAADTAAAAAAPPPPKIAKPRRG